MFDWKFVFLLCILQLQDVSGQPLHHADSLYAVGDSLYFESDYKSAAIMYSQAIEFHRDSDSISLSMIHNDLGLMYLNLGQGDSAIKNYRIAMALDLENGDMLRVARRLRSIGNVYREKGEFSEALEHYHKAYDLVVELRLPNEMGAYAMSIGNLFFEQGNYVRALGHYRQSFNSYAKESKPSKMMLILNNLGNVYYRQSKFDSALYFLKKSERLKTDLGETRSLAYTYHTLGLVYEGLQNTDSAMHFLEKAFEIRKTVLDERGAATTANELAEILLKNGELIKSRRYLNISKEYADREDNRSILLKNLALQADYFKRQNQLEKAYDHLERWSILRDSVFNDEKVKVLELQGQFELRRKEQERNFQEQQAKFQMRRADDQLMITWIISLFGFGALILVFFMMIQRNKIRKLHKDLDLINRDIRHRKTNDYTRVLVTLQNESFSEIDTVRNMLIASNAVDETLYGGEEGSVVLQDYLTDLLHELAVALNVDKEILVFKSELGKQKKSTQAATKVGFILCELMTNTVKHSIPSQRQKIEIHLTKDDDSTLVRYIDVGPETSLEALSSSSGQGWKIVNQFATQLDGSLEFERKAGQNNFRLTFKN